ncbi:MAG: PorP/SprF family type IX secretion system membrane protein [Saprospiraceae bacterium]
MQQSPDKCFAAFRFARLVFTKVGDARPIGCGSPKLVLRLAVLFIGIAVSANVVSAQSWPQSSLWNQSPLRLNPASSGNLYSLDASAGLRRQWQGIQGAPSSTQFTVGAPVYIANAGISLGFERDEVGLQVVNLFRGGLAYKVFEKDELSVSLGGAVTYRQASLNGAGLRTSDGTYANGIVTHFDNLLPIGEQASSSLGFDGGIEIKWKETKVGVSLLDLNEPTSNWSGVNRKWSRTILTHASTLVPVAELVDIEASALLQIGTNTMQSAASITAWYDNNIGVGSSLRGYSGNTLDAVSLLIGWKPSNKITLAYAYDFGLSTLVRSHQGSHEVVVRYVMIDPIGRGKLPPIIFNPRL